MLQYTKQQMLNRTMRQAIGFSVVVAVVIAAIFVTIAAVSSNEPEINNRMNTSLR